MSEILFHAIKTFVGDLADAFSTDNHALALYERLLCKTSISHTEAVNKHISAVRKFYEENKEKIRNNDLSQFSCNIEYSQKVFIDMNAIMVLAGNDAEARKNIHLHLLTIGALLVPHGVENIEKGIIDTLRNSTDLPQPENSTGIRFDGDSNEEQFLNDIMKCVETSIDPNDVKTPKDAVSKIMDSGIMNNLVTNVSGKIASGNLDITKMFGAVQKMMGDLTKDAPKDDPQIANLMGMMNMVGSTLGARR